jgi:hypothetical protein
MNNSSNANIAKIYLKNIIDRMLKLGSNNWMVVELVDIEI